MRVKADAAEQKSALPIRLAWRPASRSGLVQKNVAYTLHEVDVAQPSYLGWSRFFTIGDYVRGRVIRRSMFSNISCRLASVLRAFSVDTAKIAKAQARAQS